MTYHPDPLVAAVLGDALHGHRLTAREARGAAAMLRALVACTEPLHLGDEPLRARLLDAAELLDAQVASRRRTPRP